MRDREDSLPIPAAARTTPTEARQLIMVLVRRMLDIAWLMLDVDGWSCGCRKCGGVGLVMRRWDDGMIG